MPAMLRHSGAVTGSSFTGSNPAGTLFRRKKGPRDAPPRRPRCRTATTSWASRREGYGATAFSWTRGGMFVRASENWTDTAQGTSARLQHDDERDEHAGHADDDRQRRQRRHRHDGAVGSPGYGEGQRLRPLRDRSHAIRGNIKQRRTKHRAADGARNQSGSECGAAR